MIIRTFYISRINTHDMRHEGQFRRWNDIIKSGGAPIIPYEEVMNTSNAAIACVESLTKRSWIKV